jgi:transcriptional regulator GlxA family with amidase domain
VQWLLAQRIRSAQELLEASDMPIERIARAAGFGTSASLRQHFRRIVSVSPQDYRATFSARRPVGMRPGSPAVS